MARNADSCDVEDDPAKEPAVPHQCCRVPLAGKKARRLPHLGARRAVSYTHLRAHETSAHL
eukprot:3274386-Alexandrium_andersonii.AAC.1